MTNSVTKSAKKTSHKNKCFMRKPHSDGTSIQSPFSTGLIFTHHKVLESCVLIQVKRQDFGCFPSKKSLIHLDIFLATSIGLKAIYK